ncbi:elongation factor P lysine(34) lysyltransferase [Endozoicomonas sp. OPT23]|uniref:EF-P lysine aminoacylase EpmA n=1 Tax=Endozoicomonas sp. OPT23 TaxID=2072845 RepID=UPI00129AFBF1|nr:EF-P lysine aminoacylase EpmA [Endozoicomonas sp. OPT23]MRI35437.1 elongation factor P lysine(34) lysyltransferase [Endozoicomonas sp. OPT23]
MQVDDWMPSADLMNLKRRADLYRSIRQYFDEQCVLEIETPLLSAAATVDLHIESFKAEFLPDGGLPADYYLQTSPEFPMKRLLSSGSGDIYSLGKVFRNGEAGGRHNPEFTMLEYYRLGMDQQQLMSDLSNLLARVTDFSEQSRFSYREVFIHYLGVNPHQATIQQLNELVQQHVDRHLCDLEKNDCLDLLFSTVVEPNLGIKGNSQLNGVFVYDYPASMSALAKLHTNKECEKVAARFELFINGVELANGYHELTDGDEQQVRFEQERDKRKELNRKDYPHDQRMVNALKQGMPDCAGVAMGIDRLLMLILGTRNISDVLAFDFSRA